MSENIKRWIIFHSANIDDNNSIIAILEKQLAIVEKIKSIADIRKKPDIVEKTLNYWLATDIYGDFPYSAMDFDILMIQNLKNEISLLKTTLIK
ncbi:hypothetical protein [Ferroplasma sp. Type II]|uniref:hypothetical protein n=1 Tax=Ferroplasma sp. Type II TaxID=261388 RepID=UPI0025B96703|nr:hypothetical protein [Ferroplasma sp. Type II]